MTRCLWATALLAGLPQSGKLLPGFGSHRVGPQRLRLLKSRQRLDAVARRGISDAQPVELAAVRDGVEARRLLELGHAFGEFSPLEGNHAEAFVSRRSHAIAHPLPGVEGERTRRFQYV